MIPHCLSKDDYEAVRSAVLRYEQEHDMTHADVAVACRLSHNAVKDFMSGRRDSCRVVAHLLGYLALGLTFMPPVVVENCDT